MTPTQFNTSRDWASLARDEKHRSHGQVYIGVGDHNNPLSEIFAGEVNDGDYVNCMNGDAPSLNYFVEIKRWELHTGLNHSEIIGKKETVTVVDTSQDWAALASQSAEKSVPTGYVYVGNGDDENHLSEIFGGECLHAYISGSRYDGLRGDSENLDYFIDIARWEKYTGLKYSDIISKESQTIEKTMTKIYTPYTPALNTLAKEILATKVVNYEQETKQTGFLFYDASCSLVSDASISKTEFDSGGNFKEVSMAEFISVLTALPEKQKSVKLTISSDDDDDFDVTLEADLITIGCHKFSSEEFSLIEEAVDKITNGVEIPFKNRRTVVINRDGIEADGDSFSFATFKKVQSALNTLREE